MVRQLFGLLLLVAALGAPSAAQDGPCFDVEISGSPVSNVRTVRVTLRRAPPGGWLRRLDEPVYEPSDAEAPGPWHVLRRFGGGMLADQGEPELPVLVVKLPVGPDQGVASVAVVSSATREWQRTQIAPAAAPWAETSDARPKRIRQGVAYSRDSLWPERVYEVGETAELRDANVATLLVYPFAVNAKRATLRVHTTLELRVKLGATGWRGSVNKRYSSVFAHSYAQFAGPYYQPEAYSREGDGCDYVIAAPREFEAALRPLVADKKQRGIVVRFLPVEKPEGPVARGAARTGLLKRLKKLYQSTPSFSYLLLVGDDDVIPAWTASVRHPSTRELIATDHYYGTLGDDGADAVADVAVGRLPAENAAQVQIMVDKILAYTRAINEEPWGRVVVASEERFQRRRDGQGSVAERYFLQTAASFATFLRGKEYDVRSVFTSSLQGEEPRSYADGSTLPGELVLLGVRDAARQLRREWAGPLRLVLHRDHGRPDGWVNPNFDGAALRQCDTPKVPPIVLSLNCETGRFDRQGGSCLAEELIRAENGACAVVAATRVTYSGYNDRFAEGLVRGLWPDYQLGFAPKAYREALPDAPRIGPLLDEAEHYVRTCYPVRDGYKLSQLTVQMFHLFGDPEMRVARGTRGAGWDDSKEGDPGREGVLDVRPDEPRRRYPSSFPEGARW